MKAFTVQPTSSPQSLTTLLGVATPRHVKAIGLQAPEANAANINFGDAKIQPGELRPKANALLLESSFAEVYVLGNGSDLLTVFLFSG